MSYRCCALLSNNNYGVLIMQAIEVEATVSEYHCIHVQLPDDWVSKRVRGVILQDEELKSAQKGEPIKLGLFRGQIEMDENFDNELSDEFWLSGNP